MHIKHTIIAIFSLILINTLSVSQAFEISTETLSLNEDIDVDINIYSTEGDKAFLWMACNQGSEGAETYSAAILAEHGIEVWLPDMLSAHFLPPGPSSIYQIPGEQVADIIDKLHSQLSDKKIYLVSGGRAAAPLLRGAHVWEKRHAKDNKKLAGAILLYPRVTLKKPEPGKEPVYIEVVGKVKLPILILEGERTPNRWGLPHLKQQFQKGSRFVESDLIPKSRGYFYVRKDQTEAEQSMTRQLPFFLMSHVEKLN